VCVSALTAWWGARNKNRVHPVNDSNAKDSHYGDWTKINQWYIHVYIHTQPFNGPWSGTTRVGRYQKKHSPTHTHPDHRTSFINFLHLLWSIASSLFSLRAWQSSLKTSLQVLFGLPLGLRHSTTYSMHFFTQSSSSFRSTCPYQGWCFHFFAGK